MKGHEGRGIGLYHKIRAYALQQQTKVDTCDANIALGFHVDSRDYAQAARFFSYYTIVHLKDEASRS